MLKELWDLFWSIMKLIILVVALIQIINFFKTQDISSGVAGLILLKIAE